MKVKNYHIPIFVPHVGCPHDCVFCNQRHITGQTAETTSQDVRRITEEHLASISAENRYIEVAFFGGSFTGIEIEKQTELMSAAYEYVMKGKIDGIRCSTRPDYITEEILDNFKKFGGKCIELGVQSSDEYVLSCSRRGHSFDDVKKASELIKKKNISLGLQMMVGLVGDTAEKTLKTAKDIISLKPDCVRIYPTLVVKDTELYNMYKSGVYKALSVEDAVSQLGEIIPMFERENISVIRVGLQTTDEINSDMVYGPYHPAIKELAEGRIIRNVMENIVMQKDDKKIFDVICHPSRISEVIGHKKCNAEYFKEKYSIDLRVSGNCELNVNILNICGKNVDIYAKLC